MIERELKLLSEEPGLLDRLAAVERLGPLVAVGRRRERQQNAYFDTATGALGAAALAFRRRTVPEQRLAAWTLKAEGSVLRGIASRPEVEVYLAPETPPALALEVLGQAARQRGSAALAEQLAQALAGSAPVRAEPFLVLETERRLVDLVAEAEGWAAELALDRVRLSGHPAFREEEIEVELRRGSEAALEAARAAIGALGATRPARASKLERALDHARACRGCGEA